MEYNKNNADICMCLYVSSAKEYIMLCVILNGINWDQEKRKILFY